MAMNYNNLGNVHATRGKLDRAVEMYEKALAIDKELGRREGMASNYGNLGNVYKTRGNFAEARRVWMIARDLYRAIGIPHMEAKLQGRIDALPPDDPPGADAPTGDDTE
jgi:tetratricopeptide (TPR) repeat protein